MLYRLSLATLLVGACSSPASNDAFDTERIEGRFSRASSTLDYAAWSTGPGQARLDLDVNGMHVEVDMNLAAGVLHQNGHHDALQRADLNVLWAARDALGAQHPEWMDLLHGELLLRHLDRLAEAAPGLEIGQHDTVLDPQPRWLRSATCGDDGLTCLAGTSGNATAYYQPDGGVCTSVANHEYGENHSWCRGRCGAGCASWWFPDDDYTQDCFDHDTCVDELNAGNFFWDVDCGDEFWEADDDYFGTYIDAC